MRTTLILDDHLVSEARQIASLQNLSLGVVISQLALRGLDIPAPHSQHNGFPVFNRPPTPTIVSMQTVLDAEDDD